MKFPDVILGLISRYESDFPGILVERIKAGILPKDYTYLYNVRYELYMSIKDDGGYNIKGLDLSEYGLTELPVGLPIELEVFNCEFNEIVSLPKVLPRGLKILGLKL